MVTDKFVVTCHRIQGKICVKVWDLQMALISQSAAGELQGSGDGSVYLLFQKDFDEPNPHPLRTWTLNADELQIILSSEVKDESNEPRTKSIIALNFV